MQEVPLKVLVKTYFDSQKFRVKIGNRIVHVPNCNVDADVIEEEIISDLIESSDAKPFDPKDYRLQAKKQRMAEKNQPSVYGFGNACKRMIDGYTTIEKDIVKEMEEQLTAYPISQWLMAHRGIGVVFAAGLIAYIEDINRFNTVSKLWQYSGMGVYEICQDCGKRVIRADRGAWIMHMADRLEWANEKVTDKSKIKTREQLVEQATGYVCLCEHPNIKVIGQRRMPGMLLDYNPDFKKLCYLIGDQFIKQRESPYRKLYDQYRLEYETRPDLIAEMQSKKGKGSVKVKGEHVEVKGTAHINAMARRKTVKIFLSHLWEEWRTIEGLPTPDPYAFGVLGHVDKVERMKFEYK